MLLLGVLGTAQAEDKRLHVYNWADFIGTRTLQRFERQTGIKVVYDTYDAEETMEAKLLAGGSGYDVVSASTNFFSREIKAGVYRPLDKRKLPNWKNLDPRSWRCSRPPTRPTRTRCRTCMRSMALPTTST